MNAIAAIGKFDALHRGHRALVARAGDMGEAVMLSFGGMAEVLGWEPREPVVAPRDRERVLRLWREQLGGDIATLHLPFAELRELDPDDFVRLLVEGHGIAGIVTGPDFRFGRGRSGDVSALQRIGTELGLRIDTVPSVLDDGQAISSSRVRDCLERGAVAEAATLLGRPHRLCAQVRRGDGRGRQLGFPTANCQERANLSPGAGVYAAWAVLDDGEPLPAAVNIGHLPSIGDGRALSIEAHLIDWQGDCYHAAIALDFIDRLRDERRFASLAALREQIARDVEAARARLAS